MPYTLLELRRRFFDGAPLPDNALPAPILHSWQRCKGRGLPVRGHDTDRLDASALRILRERNAGWMAQARPHMEALFEQVVDDGHVVILADREGVILEEMGHPAFLDRAERVALTPGMDWREEMKGTNAIGTALLRRDRTLVRGAEHYLERNRQLACVANAILDPFGEPVGVLDISGPPRKLGTTHAGALDAATRMIEHALFGTGCGPDRMILSLHQDPSSVLTPRAARLAFDEHGILQAANRAACSGLGLTRDQLGQLRFQDLFDETLEHWLNRNGSAIALLRHHGRRWSACLEPRTRPAPPARTPPAIATRPAPAFRRPPETDSVPEALLRMGSKLLEADIPVLIQGETGTGKDRFARALHAASQRAGSPFIAINCAAIPDTLAEAELFGYEEGAFTGARRQGSKGKLREADGGTLFLDEIGDMPLSLQARLLRVLQDRSVSPLGGGAARQVDFRLICATHRNLQALTRTGQFREDLYYRICHYPICLPPLRERGDVAAIAQQILSALGAGERGICLTPDLATRFRRYAWPGNLRELSNLLQTLMVLVDDGTALGTEHLPPPLLQAMQQDPAPPLAHDDTLLARFGGNASAMARALGISRSTLYRRRAKARG